MPLKTGIRAKPRVITWDRQVLRSTGKRDETPPAVTGGTFTQSHTLTGDLAKADILKQKRYLGDRPVRKPLAKDAT